MEERVIFTYIRMVMRSSSRNSYDWLFRFFKL